MDQPDFDTMVGGFIEVATRALKHAGVYSPWALVRMVCRMWVSFLVMAARGAEDEATAPTQRPKAPVTILRKPGPLCE